MTRTMDKVRARLEDAEVVARRLSRHITESCPKGWGFILMLCSFEEPGVGGGLSTYSSNCHPETIPTALREFADMLDRRESGL